MRAVLQEILEAEMTDALGAAKSERTTGRLGYRAGYDGRTLITRVGKLELRVPQDRWSGSGKEWSGRLPLRADMVALTAAAVAISMA
jgi:mutator family transposase